MRAERAVRWFARSVALFWFAVLATAFFGGAFLTTPRASMAVSWCCLAGLCCLGLTGYLKRRAAARLEEARP